VNIAARLEGLAEPGGICVSAKVCEEVKNKLSISFKDMGAQEVKNIQEPVRVYSWTTNDSSTSSVGATSAPPLPDKPSIAVLPFDNMSSDPEQEHFSDGLTEDIITALSRISGLLVIARNSTMVYKGKAVDVKQVGREQGVRHVLEGSVRRIGDRVRVTVQLIEAATGHHQWAERYDRTLDDIFEVQDDLTKQVTTELQVKLATGEEARVWARETSSVAAWERLIKAIPLSDEHVRQSNSEAQRLAAEATELDPDYATAWSTLGWTHWEDALWGWGDTQEYSLDVARNCAERAFQLDSEHPDALSLLGYIYMLEKDATKAIELCKRAVRSSPNHASTLALAGLTMIFSGDPDGGLSMMNRAIRLSPIHPVWYQTMIGVVQHLAGDHAKAIEIFRTCVAEEPESLVHRIWLVSALVEVGDTEKVKEHVTFILETEPGFSSAENVNSFSNYDDLTNKILKNLSMAGLPP
jgi:adenylate cyclase